MRGNPVCGNIQMGDVIYMLSASPAQAFRVPGLSGSIVLFFVFAVVVLQAPGKRLQF